MKAIAIFTFSILTSINYGCSVNTSDIDRYKNEFRKHKNEFDDMVTLLKRQDLEVGHSVNQNELPDDVRRLLEKLGISILTIERTVCKDSIDYQFTSTWSRNATLYFSKDPCDKEQTNEGFHSKPSEMIEVWGLGDGWVMWVDYDFI